MAYVGAVRVTVTNNTIIDPERWVFRILQETVDATRFLPCGDNVFQNNLVVFRSTLSRHVNIGANTAPSTFTLRNNLWYNVDAPSSSRPQEAQLTETSSISGSDPLLRGYATGDYRPQPSSPVKGAGIATPDAVRDLAGRMYANPPSIGAYEADETTFLGEHVQNSSVQMIRTSDGWWLTVPEEMLPLRIRIVDLRGSQREQMRLEHGRSFVPTQPSEFVTVDP